MTNYDIRLKIENPCINDWDSMIAENSRRYCLNCSKTVFDFTSLDDQEVLKIIKQSTGRLCGRFRKDQLNRLLVQSEWSFGNSRFYKMLTGVLLFFSAKNLKGNKKWWQRKKRTSL